MVIKSMTRKSGSWQQLLDYMANEKGTGGKGPSFVIRHNVRGTTTREWAACFERNEKGRQHRRSNAVKVFHEVMSIHPRDRKHITEERLKDLARKYIELRNPDALYVAIPHRDKGHWHVHFCISGVEAVTGKSLRISKEQFGVFKQKVQAYQIERYPELSNSVVNHRQKAKGKTPEREYQLVNRTKGPSERERVQKTVEQCFRASLSLADFHARLQAQGLNTYERNGQVAGIAGDRKMRFSSMGLDKARMRSLDEREKALNGIEEMRGTKDGKAKEPLEPPKDREDDKESTPDARDDKGREETQEQEQDIKHDTDEPEPEAPDNEIDIDL